MRECAKVITDNGGGQTYGYALAMGYGSYNYFYPFFLTDRFIKLLDLLINDRLIVLVVRPTLQENIILQA